MIDLIWLLAEYGLQLVISPRVIAGDDWVMAHIISNGEAFGTWEVVRRDETKLAMAEGSTIERAILNLATLIRGAHLHRDGSKPLWVPEDLIVRLGGDELP